MRTITSLATLVCLLVAPLSYAQTADHAERIAASMQLQPQESVGGGTQTGKLATVLGLVGGGVAMVLLGDPSLEPSQFTPAVIPGRVDLSQYVDLTRMRGANYGLYNI